MDQLNGFHVLIIIIENRCFTVDNKKRKRWKRIKKDKRTGVLTANKRSVLFF